MNAHVGEGLLDEEGGGAALRQREISGTLVSIPRVLIPLKVWLLGGIPLAQVNGNMQRLILGRT